MRLRDIVSYAVVANHTILGMERNLQVPLPVIRHIDDPFAVSANPTIDHSKPPRSRRNEQPLPPIMKNERNKPNNPTETRTIPARTQIAKPYSELGINDSTGHRNPILSQTRGSSNAPPQRIPRVDEVESRGWGRRAPQSPSSSSFGAPQGNNEIYTYDVVFSPGEARKKIHSQPQLPYNAPAGNPQSLT